MNMPQEPGYYWAKWKIAADGTHEGEDLTPAVNWEIVQVNANVVDWADIKDEDGLAGVERLSVSVPGVREVQWRDCFVWGSKVAHLDNRLGGKGAPAFDKPSEPPIRVATTDIQLVAVVAAGSFIADAIGLKQTSMLFRRVDHEDAEDHSE